GGGDAQSRRANRDRCADLFLGTRGVPAGLCPRHSLSAYGYLDRQPVGDPADAGSVAALACWRTGWRAMDRAARCAACGRNDLRTFPCSCSRKKRGGGVASSPTAAKLVLLFSQTGIRPSPCSLPHGNAVMPASLHAGEARRSGLIRITHALHALHRLRAEEQVEVGRHLDG